MREGDYMKIKIVTMLDNGRIVSFSIVRSDYMDKR